MPTEPQQELVPSAFLISVQVGYRNKRNETVTEVVYHLTQEAAVCHETFAKFGPARCLPLTQEAAVCHETFAKFGPAGLNMPAYLVRPRHKRSHAKV